MAETNVAPPNLTLTEGIILAVVPAAAYLAAFSYEIGYALRLRYPMQFIEVTLNTFTLSLVAVATSAAFMLLYFKAPDFGKLVVLLLLSAAILTASFIYPPNWPWWGVGLLWLVALLIAVAATWLALLPRSSPVTTWRLFASPGAVDIQRLLILYIFTIHGTIAIGAGMARTQSTFYVIPGDPERLVIRLYGTRAICVPFSEETLTYRREFSMVNVEGDGVALVRKNLGPIRADD